MIWGATHRYMVQVFMFNGDNIVLKTVMDTVLDGLVIIDAKGTIKSFNIAAEKIFGYSADEVLEKNVKMLMPAPYQNEHDSYLGHYLSTGEKKVIGIGRTVKAKRKDGHIFPMELGVNEMIIEGNRMFVGTIRDISERERLIENLTSSNEELQRFAFICSHDLQEPLRMIRSFSDKLKIHIADQLEGNGKAQRYFKFVIDGAELAQNLISDILSYSSIGADAMHTERVDMNKITALIKAACQPVLEERQATIRFADLPVVTGNKTQIYQLLQNLINNALKYQLSDSKPTVQLAAEDKGMHWLISVKDNGIGIEARHIAKIFNVFQRLNKKSEYPGTGIGLAICKKIIEHHGGTIWAESEKGNGATFFFTLPKQQFLEAAHERTNETG